MLKIGDSVIVRPEFWKIKSHGGLCIAPEMEEMTGNTLTIRATEHADVKEWYKVKENIFTWDENWIEPVKELTMTDINTDEFVRMFE